ncbi:MAG TPA: radical SAM family heme chaperone HemW [Terriglobales bacterium]|nr:radical SAM family heme chaperone HemW [Terriglobales bacterium]
MSKKKIGLYIHIPFCTRKCPYCDFYSVCDLSMVNRYLAALIKQMEEYGRALGGFEADTVYFGGGTPSLLEKGQWKELLEALHKNFSVSETAEVTIEVNPASADYRLLKFLRKAGVNRLSVGVQSFNDTELAKLGRLHSASDARNTLKDAKKAGFGNLSVDLMYGLPGQTAADFARSLDEAVGQGIQHLSAYGLKIEPNTPFGRAEDALDLPDEEVWCEMYEKLVGTCEAAGLMQYEISNFARPGFESRHNLKYWTLAEYLGLGPAAHSYLGGRRFAFARDLTVYCRAFEGGDDAGLLSEDYEAPASGAVADYIMLSLRLKPGLSTADFTRRFRKSFEELEGGRLDRFVAAGLMTHEDGRYAFTTKGFCVSNAVLAELIDLE